MRRRSLTATFVAALVAGSTSAQSAMADDYYPDTSFQVLSAKATPSTVSVRGLETVPVTITMSTTTAEGKEDQSGNVMALSENGQYPQPNDLSVTLELIGQKGATKQWRGIVNVGGASRTVAFNGAYNCEFGCNSYPTWISGPSIRVRGADNPVVTFDKPSTTDLTSKTYSLSGRVLNSSKRSYGRRLTVIVGQGPDCSNTSDGTPVRTNPAGQFTTTLSNRVLVPERGAPVLHQHCVKLLSKAQDARNRKTFLAYATTSVPWTMTLPVRAPQTVKRGATAVLASAAPIGAGAVVVLERLHGRTAWRPLSYSTVRRSGRISSYLEGTALGRHVYRLRVTDAPVVSEPFVTVTVR